MVRKSSLTESNLKKFYQTFQENGFVRIPNFLTENSLKTLNLSVDHILNQIDNASHGNETHFERGSRIVFQDQKLHRIVWAQSLDPEFALNSTMSSLKKLIRFFLGIESHLSLYQIINQLHIKSPEDKVTFQYHQDAENRGYGTNEWNDVLNNGSFIQTAIALSPLHKENGTLQFFSGSHQEGYLNLISEPNKLKNLKKKYPKVILECEPGDLVAFHPFCVHGSDSNLSDHQRRIFINGFCPKGANNKHYPGCGMGKKL